LEENKTIIVYILVLALVMFTLGWLTVRYRARPLESQIEELEKELIDRQSLLDINLQLIEEIKQLREDNEILHQRMGDWLDTWKVEEVEVTAYAPLSPRAIPGMCYSGDPRVTASSEKVVPGVTAAAGPDIEFGTRVWVENIGFRIIQDRGGRVNRNDEDLRQLDLAVWSREEAFRIGRYKTIAAFEK